MKPVQLPKQYQHVMPYLIVQDADKFISYLQQVFDAKEKQITSRDDGSLMHAEMMIGDSTIMLANASDNWGVENAGLYVNVADADATYKKAIDAGGTTIMELSDQPYGRTSGVKDPFGNTWWITTPAPATLG